MYGARPAAARGHFPPDLALPQVGPAWFGAVMGTGILATLTEIHRGELPGASVLSMVLLGLGWLLMCALGGVFLLRAAVDGQVWRASVDGVAAQVSWGMVAMGILAVGSATANVLPAHLPALTEAAWWADRVLWTLGTVIGVVAALGFAVRLVGKEAGAPSTTWALPLVPPMVSATTGAALIPNLGSRPGQFWLLLAVVAGFFMSLFLGSVVFAEAYRHHWRIAPLPVAAATSAWIPLGMVGQSTAAAQSIAAQARQFLLPGDHGTAQTAANAYGLCALAIGVPLVVWAVAKTLQGFAAKMPFTLGWWALTFPVGTLSLGTHMLAAGTGWAVFDLVSVVAWICLLGTWTLCAVSTVRAVWQVARH